MATTKNPTKKFLFQMLGGALFGAAAMAAVLALLGDSWIKAADRSTIIAVTVGISYALMGLVVGIGVMAPRTGARFLNVEDEEDLREQRPVLRVGAVSCFLIGLFVLALAASGPLANLMSREVAALVALGLLAAVLILSVAMNKRTDELTRQVSLESSALTLYVTLVLFGGWAVLARLGYVDWVSPLAFVALLALSMLIATMIASGRKGLLTPR